MRIRVETAISYSLILGVLISSALMVSGLTLLFLKGGAGPYDVDTICSFQSPVNTRTFTLSQAIEGLGSFNGLSYIYLGAVVLIATPVTRVVLLIGQFASERNKLYLFLSLLVMTNLTFALLILPTLARPRSLLLAFHLVLRCKFAP